MAHFGDGLNAERGSMVHETMIRWSWKGFVPQRNLQLLMVLGILSCGGEDVNQFGLTVPAQVGDWVASGEDAVYDRDTLYDYMNGGAEVYLSYDYRKVWTRRYTGPGDEEISLDIYDMGSSAEAFGVFSTSIEDPDVGIGQGSEYGAGLLKFWKGKYFVSVVNMGINEATDEVLLDIGRAVDAAIGTTGPEPEMVGYLPEQTLNARQTTYFHSDVILNNRYFIASENVLHLDNDTDCVFAEYGQVGEDGKVLLVRYGNEMLAQEALTEFSTAYMPEAGEERLLQLESGAWTAAVRRSTFIAIVFEERAFSQLAGFFKAGIVQYSPYPFPFGLYRRF